MIGPSKVPYKKHAFYRRLSIKKLKMGILVFKQFILLKKTNGISKTHDFINFKKSGHWMGLSRKLCILGKKLAKKAQINVFLPDFLSISSELLKV